MHKEFEETDIVSILESIGKHSPKPVRCCIFGGAAMVFRGLKIATKDIDIIFDDKHEMGAFVSAAKKAEFVEVSVPKAYERLEISRLLENLVSKWRLDIFLGKFAGKLKFSRGMKKRAEPFREFGSLKTFLLSNEDIFILKSVTERKRDLEDMKMIFGFGLDWKTIEAEIIEQNDFMLNIVEGIEKLEKDYGIDIKFSGEIHAACRRQREEWARETEKRLKKKKTKPTSG